MNFPEIQSKANSEWKNLWEGDKPLILVGLATCGMAAGGNATMAAIREELARRGIEANVIPVG